MSDQNEIHPFEQAITLAQQDPEFRAALLKDPMGTLEAELGLVFPEGVELNVVENTATSTTLVLPRQEQESDELDLDQLQAVAGGASRLGARQTLSAWCYHINWLTSPDRDSGTKL